MKNKKPTAINHLLTEEGEKLLKNKLSPYDTVYPRPQMARDSFFSLNGEWDFAAYGGDGKWEKITVPYPPESLLSGICRSMGKLPYLQYRRTFTLPEGFVKDRVILHFGAVDNLTCVFINGKKAGTNEGGYLHFEFDITDLATEGENSIEVNVVDDSKDLAYPYGKQRYDRGGMWYTPVSGIWQTVWLESVPEKYIKRIKITPYADHAVIETEAEGMTDGEIILHTESGETTVILRDNRAEIVPETVNLWSPENPYLYRFTLKMGEDTIDSYFALRTLESKTVDGIPRLCLNGDPYFFHGLLDQGYYSDGIYTPASPKCYEDDILTAKKLGFNTLRKHIKIEPEIFYYYCDLHGMVVFQDMVNNGSYSFIRDTALPTLFMRFFPDKLLNKDLRVRHIFHQTMEDTVKTLYNHPCICYWTIFNEGWGQFDSTATYEKFEKLDTTRFIDTASGWYHPEKSHVESQHIYFKPYKLTRSYSLPVVLSEFGGYSCKLPEHSANMARTYGYKAFETVESLEDAIVSLYENEIAPAIKKGLCASILTQLTDVEDEVNGLITYDRKKLKVTEEKMRELSKKLTVK